MQFCQFNCSEGQGNSCTCMKGKALTIKKSHTSANQIPLTSALTQQGCHLCCNQHFSMKNVSNNSNVKATEIRLLDKSHKLLMEIPNMFQAFHIRPSSRESQSRILTLEFLRNYTIFCFFRHK